MNCEDLERRITSFDSLVPGAAELHTLTWCVKRQGVVLTRDLQGRECCLCEHFVMKGGVCDPL